MTNLESKSLKFHTKALAISALAGIQEVREEFCIFNRDGDGFVCENELKNALRNLGVNSNNIDITKIINDAEIDGNGTVDRFELIKLVTQLEDFANNVDVQNSIRAFDKSKNDFISVAELKIQQNETINKGVQMLSDNTLNSKKPPSFFEKKKPRFIKESNNQCTRYEAFVTVSIQAQPNTRIGCKLQDDDAEGLSEVEEWKKRWRRNAAMRSSSKIFPKTWWMLLAKLEIYVYEKENIQLKLKTYYWLND